MGSKQKGRGKKVPTSRLKKQSGAFDVLPPETLRPQAQSKVMALVCNGEKLDDHLLEQVKMTLAQGVPVILYAYVPKYSFAMKPLGFGEALGLIPNEHGQVTLAIYTHYDDEQEVAFDVLGMIGQDFNAEVSTAWDRVYSTVWVQPESTELEVAEPEATPLRSASD